MTDAIDEERVFSILAVQVMGGIGKTTLTRKLFNHERIHTRFGESRIWVHVSQNFDPLIIFKRILEKLTSSVVGVATRQVVLEKLYEALKDRTYLLVLDDVWNEDQNTWENFMNSLAGVTSTKGNSILVTTRIEKVASVVRPLAIHRVEGLSDEDCWSIIKSRAFDKGDDPSEFEAIGGNIARKCHGLPLAANVVGGVLYKASEQKWYSIEDNWLAKDEGQSISDILRLSFDNLSLPSLKKCFAYCSIFPKGHRIVKQEMIELWMAEGFLQPDRRDDDMESVGDRFWNVLVHNSLLQVCARDYYVNEDSFVMHDLVHDLASVVLCSSNNEDGLLVRYMIRKDYDSIEESTPIPKEMAKHLRTLILGGEISGTTFSDFECLHVLIIDNYGVKSFPNSIRKLIHLRNLNISRTIIESLPDWIGELHHLQTLRADIGGLCVLPSTMKNLINLRHLVVNKSTQLPAEIGRLTSLQTLTHFRVGDNKGYQIEELGGLNNLKGKLEIHNLEKVCGKEEALKAKMFQKPNLIDLCFAWDIRGAGEANDETVLEGLQPYPNLKKLEIIGFNGKQFPLWTERMAVRDDPRGSWVGLDKLTEIHLSKCEECEEIPTLEHLPNLKSLGLCELKKVRFINSSFSGLTWLSIRKLESLECLPDWLFYNNQNISELEISYCPKLRELPDGLDTLNSLEKLTILDCPNLNTIGNRNPP